MIYKQEQREQKHDHRYNEHQTLMVKQGSKQTHDELQNKSPKVQKVTHRQQ